MTPFLLPPALTLTRQGDRIGVSPPSPELKDALAALKPALLYAMEDGEVLRGQDLLRIERLALLLVGRELGTPAWLTPYPGERVLVPTGHLRPHLLWRVRNFEAPHRLHLTATTGGFTLDLRHLVVALLQAEVEGEVLLLGGPLEDLLDYLSAAEQAMRSPTSLVVEGPGGRWKASSWQEALGFLTLRGAA